MNNCQWQYRDWNNCLLTGILNDSAEAFYFACAVKTIYIANLHNDRDYNDSKYTSIYRRTLEPLSNQKKKNENKNNDQSLNKVYNDFDASD